MEAALYCSNSAAPANTSSKGGHNYILWGNYGEICQQLWLKAFGWGWGQYFFLLQKVVLYLDQQENTQYGTWLFPANRSTAHCRQLLCSAGNNLWKKTMQQRARRPLICRHSKIERSRMRLSLWGWGPILPRVRGAKVKAPRPSAGWRHQLGCCSQPPQPPPLQRWWVGTIYTHRGTQPVFLPHSDTRQSPPPHSTLICFPVPKTHAGCFILGSDSIIMFL